MTKKLIIIIGSALIGIISMLTVIFTMIATGAIEVEQKTIVFSSASAEAVYSGNALTAEEWEILSANIDVGNDHLLDATRYYYSEEEPAEEGNFWHYDENGEIAVW